ncbi:hypothetical protein JCM11251_006844 [Rhodosporidiobolus azoricus]
MLSLLRRNNNASAGPSKPSPAPSRLEPPPPRRAKELSWLASIGGKGKGVDRGVGHVVQDPGKGKGGAREEEEDWVAIGDSRGGKGGAASLRSRRSFRLGKDKERDKDTPLPLPTAINNKRSSISSSYTNTRRPPSSAPPLSSASFSPQSLHPPSTPVPASPSPTHATTVNLAQCLQELAVANADGLLDDEEYRVLRAQVFESTMGGGGGGQVGQVDEQVRKAGEGGLAVPRLAMLDEQRVPTEASPFTPSSPSLSNSPTARAPSIFSSQSRRASMLDLAGGLFRKGSIAPSVRSGVTDREEQLRSPTLSRYGVDGDGASVFSGRSGYSHAIRSANRSEPAAYSSTNGYSTSVRTRSIRNHPGQSSSALDLRSPNLGGAGESVVSGSTEGSYRRSSVYRSPVSAGSLSPGKSRNGHGFTSAYSPPSSRASSTRFETLSSLAHSNSHSPPSQQPSLPPIPSSSDPSVLAATDREPSSAELRDEIAEIEAEWRRMGENWDAVLGDKVGRWRGEVGEEVVQRSGGMVVLSRAGLAEVGQKATRRGEGDETVKGKKSIFRRASFNVTSHNMSLPSTPTPATSALPPPSTVPLPAFLLPSTSSLSTSPTSLATPPSLPPDLNLPDSLLTLTNSFISDVSSIREKKRHTDEAYQKRIEFLRSRLRGAEIREGVGKR